MGRAFSPWARGSRRSWGVAPGWYSAPLLALGGLVLWGPVLRGLVLWGLVLMGLVLGAPVLGGLVFRWSDWPFLTLL